MREGTALTVVGRLGWVRPTI